MADISWTIEIATNDFETTRAAVEGGAHRIELCSSLSEGGVTPSAAMIRKCRETFQVPLFPIIRPRGGDFLFTEDEFEIMKEDILFCKETGCDGVVIGMLKRDGSIPLKRTASMIELAYPLEVTFHRAFDRCNDPFEAMEQLIQSGCSRILTSGQKPTAPEGADLIRRLVEAADHRIIVMPGSGVRKENIKQLAGETGAVEFHSSLRSKKRSKMEFTHPAFAHSDESYMNPAIDPSDVRNLLNALSG